MRTTGIALPLWMDLDRPLTEAQIANHLRSLSIEDQAHAFRAAAELTLEMWLEIVEMDPALGHALPVGWASKARNLMPTQVESFGVVFEDFFKDTNDLTPKLLDQYGDEPDRFRALLLPIGYLFLVQAAYNPADVPMDHRAERLKLVGEATGRAALLWGIPLSELVYQRYWLTPPKTTQGPPIASDVLGALYRGHWTTPTALRLLVSNPESELRSLLRDGLVERGTWDTPGGKREVWRLTPSGVAEAERNGAGVRHPGYDELLV